MSLSWRLGRIGPLLVRVNYTWILVGGFGLWLLALLWLPPSLPDASALATWALAGGIVLVYAAGLLGIEALRVAVVRRGVPGWTPAIQLFPFGAVTPEDAQRLGASRAVVLALLTPVLLAGLALGYWELHTILTGLGLVSLARGALALALATGAVAILQLVPGLPLAGGWLLIATRAWISNNTDGAYRLARLLGLGTALGLAVAGILLILREAHWVSALALLAMGWAVREGDAATDRRRSARRLLAQTLARHLMQSPARIVQPDETLAAVFWGGARVRPGALLAVTDADGIFRGLLPSARADALLQGTWSRTAVRAVMIPAAALSAVRPDTPLPAVLAAFARQLRGQPAAASDVDDSVLAAAYVPVVDGGRLRGVISRAQVEEYESAGVRAGVQEAAELEALSGPRRTFRVGLALGLAGGLSLLVLAALSGRGPAPEPVAAEPSGAAAAPEITFTEQRPAAGAIIERGRVDLRVAIASPAPVVSVTLYLDDTPLAAQLNPATPAGQVTAEAQADASLLGLHTVRAAVYGAAGLLGQTRWTFRVVPARAAAPAPLTICVDLTSRPAATLRLDGRLLATALRPGAAQRTARRLEPTVAQLTPGAHMLSLQLAPGRRRPGGV